MTGQRDAGQGIRLFRTGTSGTSDGIAVATVRWLRTRARRGHVARLPRRSRLGFATRFRPWRQVETGSPSGHGAARTLRQEPGCPRRGGSPLASRRRGASRSLRAPAEATESPPKGRAEAVAQAAVEGRSEGGGASRGTPPEPPPWLQTVSFRRFGGGWGRSPVHAEKRRQARTIPPARSRTRRHRICGAGVVVAGSEIIHADLSRCFDELAPKGSTSARRAVPGRQQGRFGTDALERERRAATRDKSW
jgi:hypothetical protein